MPYKKRSTKSYKKKTYRRKPAYKKTSVRSGPRVEMKRNMRAISNQIGAVPFTSTTSRPFTNIQSGTHADERIGNGVFAKGHLLNGVMRNNSPKCMLVRLIYVYNRRIANSTVDTSSPLFLALGVPETAVNLGFQSLYAPLNREHFRIVSDRRFKLGSSSENGENVRIVKKYTKLSNKVRYDDSNPTNINYGNLQIFFICYPADGTPDYDDLVQLDFESTCYYTE